MVAQWKPIRNFSGGSDTFDHFFNQFWSDQPLSGQQWVGNFLPLDVAETGEGYEVKASIPGLNPNDLDVTFNNGVLTIKGEVKPDHQGDPSCYHLQERWFGQFQRSLTLPGKIQAEGIHASYEAGVLTLFLPKSEEYRPKRIQIQPGTTSKVIEGRVKQTG